MSLGDGPRVVTCPTCGEAWEVTSADRAAERMVSEGEALAAVIGPDLAAIVLRFYETKHSRLYHMWNDKIEQAETETARLREFIAEFLGAEPGDMNTSRGHKLIVRGLSQCIGDHGKAISREDIGSAAKRVATNLRNSLLATLNPAGPDAEVTK